MKIAFTITSANYVDLTKITINSFLKYNLDYKFFVFYVNGLKPNYFEYNNNIICIDIFDTKILEIAELRGKYNDFEFCNALKPFLSLWLISNIRHLKCLVYTDSDIKYFGAIDIPELNLSSYSVVLTPHVTEKMNLDFFSVNETNFLNTGIYNAGFFILNICQDVLDFLNWWKLRLLHFCFVQLERGLFVDQIWLNLVPLYFPNIFVLNHKGFNVAHWNLHERKISFSGNNYFVNEKIPLIFFHFSGLDVNDFNKISKYQNRFTIEERQDLLKLFTDYIKDLPFSPLSSDSLSVNQDVKKNRIKLFLNYIIKKVRGK